MAHPFTMTEARDVALRDLLGAVAMAGAYLAVLRSDVAIGDATAEAAEEWIADRLAAAAENVRALHHGTAPRWLTLADADAIRAGLDLLRAAEGQAEG